MSNLYTKTAAGTAPIDLATAKSYMKQISTSDDTLINTLIAAAVEYGENYTGRDFTANTWQLLIDDFADRIVLLRNPIDAITTVKYIVGGTLTLIADTVYYMKKGVQCSEILLKEDQEWPDDLDEIEHGIEIIFDTEAYTDINLIKDALLRHVAHLYTNRGDCDVKSAGAESGADALYNQIRISRV